MRPSSEAKAIELEPWQKTNAFIFQSTKQTSLTACVQAQRHTTIHAIGGVFSILSTNQTQTVCQLSAFRPKLLDSAIHCINHYAVDTVSSLS